MQKKLILFTASYPHGNGESFLDTEIKYLAKEFDQIEIFCCDNEERNHRKIPDNCSVHSIHLKTSMWSKLKACLFIFHPLFRKESNLIRHTYGKKKSALIIKTMLMALSQAYQIKKAVSGRIDKQGHSLLCLYSYWCSNTALAIALLKNKYPDIHACSRVHGWDLYFDVHPSGYLPFRHYIAENLNAIFAISQKGVDYCRNVWKIKNSEVVQLSRLGVEKQEPVSPIGNILKIVSCSNLIPLKRIDLIAKVLSGIKDIPIQWTHFGEGPQLTQMKTFTQNELPSNVTVEWKGSVPNAELLRWYGDHCPDLFINVSTTEGIPVSIMEAMSFGIPAIATNVGGVAEIVNDKNGILLDPTSTENDIRKAIVLFYHLSKEEKEHKRKAAWATWNSSYNAEKNYAHFVEQLRDL